MKYKALALLTALAIGISCRSAEEKLLESKVYFEQQEVRLVAEDISTYEYPLSARLSKLMDRDIALGYEIGGSDMVDRYNLKHGTKYKILPTNNMSLEQSQSKISAGEVYAKASKLLLKGLDSMEEGNSYVVPIRITHADLPTIEDKEMYIVINKPIIINKVFDFNSKWLSIPMPATAKFKTITMEALIYADRLTAPLKTVMGREGRLLLRFGDLPKPSAKHLQVAGGVQFNPAQEFQAQRWYHIAFVADQSTEKATIYINGEKAAEKACKEEFDLTQDCFIGYAYDYDPGRVWHGKMSEVRIWSTARSANELRNNMLGVDPASEGLFGYWKLNGTDVYQQDGKWYVRDQSKNKLDAMARFGRYIRGTGRSEQPSVVDLRVKID